MRIMQSESVRRRRMAYHRSHTLSTLPTHLVQEVDSEQEYESITERSKLIQSSDSPIHTSGSTSDLDKLMASYSEDARKELDSSWNNGKGKRQQLFTKKNMSHPGNNSNGKMSGSGDVVKNGQGARSKRLGRTPSTPSMILNRVKDRIREKVFQTSTEWPYAAAIIQERRQRSVDAFEARVAKSRKSLEKDDIEIEQVPLKELNDKQKRARMKSEPIPALVLTQSDSDICPADIARLAFRRRSISEDTYDRRPCLPKVKLDQPDNKAGIICSNEDLQAIVGKKKSPQPHKRSSLEPQVSLESSSSTYSSRSARSTRALSIEADLSPSDRVDLCAFRGAESEDMSSSLSIPGTSGFFSSQNPEPLRDTRPKEKKVSRSASLQSGNSINTLQNISPRGSKTSITLSDRRCSDRSDNNEKCSGSNSCRGINIIHSDDSDEDDDEKPKVVPEVVFDEFGQTWDVYGAEFDPEAVGDAIQRHLVKLMKRNSEDADSEKSNNGDDNTKPRESVSFWLKFLCLFNSREQSSSS